MTNTPITNESEAMEVWQEAKAAHDGCVSGDWNAPDQAAARVIATALEARDAMIRNIVSHATGGQITDATVGTGLNNICVAVSAFRNRLWKDAQEAATAERDAWIAELEGALNLLITDCGYHLRKYRLEQFNEARAILTKGNTHD